MAGAPPGPRANPFKIIGDGARKAPPKPRKKLPLPGQRMLTPDGMPACPPTSPAVQEIWDYTIEQLRELRVVTLADRDALFAYCLAVNLHREAARQLTNDGVLQDAPNGLARHPATQVLREASVMIRQLGSDFGLNPMSRKKAKMASQEGPRTSGASRLLSS